MTASGSCRGKCRLHREATPPCFVARVGARNELVERYWAIAAPQSARRTEIRNSAFGRDAGAGEWNDDGRLGDHIAQLFDAAAEIRCDHKQLSDELAVPVIARPIGLWCRHRDNRTAPRSHSHHAAFATESPPV